MVLDNQTINDMEVRDVLEGRRQELNGELQTLEMAFDDAMVSDVEYNYRKADIKSRIAEVDTIINKMANHRILSSEEDKQGCLIGSNGTISLYLRHGKDCMLWIETNGVMTRAVLRPRVSDVDNWKRILGI